MDARPPLRYAVSGLALLQLGRENKILNRRSRLKINPAIRGRDRSWLRARLAADTLRSH